MSVRCPLCAQKGVKIRSTVKAGNKNSHRKQKRLGVYECTACSLEYLTIWDNAAKVAAFYETEQYQYVTQKGAHLKFDEYEMRFSYVNPFLNKDTTRLLEIGCGDGSFLKRVRPFVKEALGVDNYVERQTYVNDHGVRIYTGPLEDVDISEGFDIICMFAVLEHIPMIVDFLRNLKKTYLKPDGHLFIEVPCRENPLANYYDIPNFRNFYYREYHLYYFDQKSFIRLLQKAGFTGTPMLHMQTSLSNHVHWMHHKRGQADKTAMTNMMLPIEFQRQTLPSGKKVETLLNDLDDYYRKQLIAEGVGDLLFCHAQPKG